MPDDAAYFHAQFRRVNKLPAKDVYTILDGVSGHGQYVGTYLAWEVHSPGWWGEGEIKFYLDGDKKFPTICGTGTEDYFCGSYNFENHETHRYQTFSTPYSGLAQVLPPDVIYLPGQRFGLYRWHIADPVRFEKDLKVTIQALGWKKTAPICRWRTTSPRWPTGIRPSRTPSSRHCRPKKTWRSSRLLLSSRQRKPGNNRHVCVVHGAGEGRGEKNDKC